MKVRLGFRSVVVALSFGLIPGCSEDAVVPDEVTTGELVVNASSQGPSPAAAAVAGAVPIGDPSSLLIGLYSFHITKTSDCAAPFATAFDNGGSPLVTDFTMSPVLFRAGAVPVGTYPCVAMRISDILAFQSAVSGGACVAGTTYRGDIYRAGGESEPFLDLSLTPITATGSDAVPSEDGVFILFSTSPAAAIARGFAQNQVVTLTSPLVVPGAMTFYWDATDAVMDNGGRCVLEPEAPALFR